MQKALRGASGARSGPSVEHWEGRRGEWYEMEMERGAWPGPAGRCGEQLRFSCTYAVKPLVGTL